ncbi:MAG: hypothetical protein SFY68_11005 [Candidatus Sumerlaeia bacterium]|nr:hypothetical protein [Candidatus Sumerlaeia bacterium]
MQHTTLYRVASYLFLMASFSSAFAQMESTAPAPPSQNPIAAPLTQPVAQEPAIVEPIFRPERVYAVLTNRRQIFERMDNGKRIAPLERVTVQCQTQTMYTGSDDQSWVGYRLTPNGVEVDLLRNSTYNSTIIFDRPWKMFPSEMNVGDTVSDSIPYTVYQKGKKPRTGKVIWEARYMGLAKVKTPLRTFENCHKIESRMKITFPLKFGLEFNQTHYFSEETGEVYREIDGDATLAGFSIRSRKLSEAISVDEPAGTQNVEKMAKMVETQNEGKPIEVTPKVEG